jgi:hypothetical protein
MGFAMGFATVSATSVGTLSTKPLISFALNNEKASISKTVPSPGPVRTLKLHFVTCTVHVWYGDFKPTSSSGPWQLSTRTAWCPSPGYSGMRTANSPPSKLRTSEPTTTVVIRATECEPFFQEVFFDVKILFKRASEQSQHFVRGLDASREEVSLLGNRSALGCGEFGRGFGP